MKGALLEADASGLRAQIEETGACRLLAGGQEVSLTRDEVEVGLVPREGYAARAGRGIVLVLDTKLTDDLIREGWAREVVAAVNELRGELSLAYEARIRLEVWCGPELRRALEENEEYVRSETLSIAVKFHALESPRRQARGGKGARSRSGRGRARGLKRLGFDARRGGVARVAPWLAHTACWHYTLNMVRTQIQLEERHLRELKRIARKEGIPLAELVRRCVIRFLEAERQDRSALYDRAAEIAGAFQDSEGREDVALHHDRYLGEAFR